MRIDKKAIRSLGRYLPARLLGKTIVAGVRFAEVEEWKLESVGFAKPFEVGQRVLPSPRFGTVSGFNANGAVLVHKDEEMETAYRMREWTWEEFRGRYDTVEQSKIVEVPYKRYPRTEIAPPSLELTIVADAKGELWIVTPPVSHLPAQEGEVLHAINLVLEIFGVCDILDEKLGDLAGMQLRRLNWRILPPGRRPWDQLKTEIDQVIRAAPKGNQSVIEYRLEKLNSYEPEFTAIGQGGFHGYVIFGYPEKGLFILESTRLNNATYALGQDWEELSQLTKAELLADELHEARLVHRLSWSREVNDLLGD